MVATEAVSAAMALGMGSPVIASAVVISAADGTEAVTGEDVGSIRIIRTEDLAIPSSAITLIIPTGTAIGRLGVIIMGGVTGCGCLTIIDAAGREVSSWLTDHRLNALQPDPVPAPSQIWICMRTRQNVIQKVSSFGSCGNEGRCLRMRSSVSCKYLSLI